ncbi:MAG: terminase family protein [bacterium]|nr:terminase family protein [bacterium]
MVQLIHPHPGQAAILNARSRFRVVACGRRFGKTETGKILLVEIALRGGRTWWLSPTYGMASQVWRDLKAALHGDQTQISETERRIDLSTGGSISIRSTHTPELLRGAGLDFAVLDEAAFMPPEVWPQVVRPMLADRKGGALFLSSPNGRNWFWEVFKLGLDPEATEWRSFHFTTADNPLIDHAELEAIRRTTPERVWRAEYLAEFSEDAGAVFRGIREAATAPTDVQPSPGGRRIMGVDWGRDRDYTCLVILDADSGHMLALDRFNQIGWELQRGRLMALYETWKPSVIWAEANSIGAVNIEALQNAGLPVRAFQTTASSKAPLIEALALAIERREIALLPDPVLLNELASYALERLPGGGYRYSAPPGGHDDTVIALALAWHGARYSGSGVDFA